MNLELALGCKDFVTSFVNGADVVPRMSFENMERLRDEALDVLARVQISKRKVLTVLSKECKDRDVAYINSLLLCPEDEVPQNTRYYQQLQDFKRAQAERKAKSATNYVPLFPPGKIVYLTRKKKGCRPQYAENTDFNEILLSPTIASDHSIVTVIRNLQDIIQCFDGNSKDRFVEDDDEDEMAGDILVLNESNDTALIDTPACVCCSLPHGSIIFLTIILGIISIICAVLANNHCNFVHRSTVVSEQDIDTGGMVSHPGIGVSTGLWSYEEKIYKGTGPRDDPSSYSYSNICRPFMTCIQPDAYLTAARICSTFANLVGGFTVMAVCFASCVRYKRIAWAIITMGFFLAMALQGLVFFVFRSDLCTTWTGVCEGTEPNTVHSTCTLGWGGKMCCVAVVFWFLTTLSTVSYPPPLSEADRTLKWLRLNAGTRSA